MTLIKNGWVAIKNERVKMDLLIENKKIIQMAEKIEPKAEYKIIDATNLLIAPGFIDVHVHMREPGQTDKEDIESCTAAAARGGYTQICSMPNTTPVIDNEEIILQMQAKIAQKAAVKVHQYAALSTDLTSTTLTDYHRFKQLGIVALTNDGKGVQNTRVCHEMMSAAKAADLMYVSHSEDENILYNGVMHEGTTNKKLGLPGIMGAVEANAVAHELILAHETGCKYHICHMSSFMSVDLLKLAQSWGVDASGEISPHHLLLNEDDIISDDVNFKMNPPLRSKRDYDRLRKAYIDHEINIIATDHAPHTVTDKGESMENSAFGIVGLETAFALLYTEFIKENQLIDLEYLINTMSLYPAQRFNLSGGKLAIGEWADITLIDIDNEYEIDSAKFKSKASNTPFNNKRVFGKIMMTICDGEIKYDESEERC